MRFMQAVILAAGRGTRMGELSDTTPKPMLTVSGKTLIEYKLDELPDEVDEVILIVGHLGSVVHDYFGGEYGGKKILYVEQETPDGTAGALWRAKDILKERFFVMNGDNLYTRTDMEACLPYEWAVLVQEKKHVGRAARVIAEKDGRITEIIESDSGLDAPGLINTGLYFLDTRVFTYALAPKAEGSVEAGLPQTMMQAAADIHIQAVPASFWVEIKTPEDLARAEEVLAQTQG